MVKYNKLLLLILIIFFALSINTYALSNSYEISFNGIKTTMPEVIDEKNYVETYENEDAQDIDIGLDETPFIQKGDIKSDPIVGAYRKPDENISQLISRFSSETTVVGIDVSSHQSEIDWKKVAESGVKFAIIRCGFRGYGDSGKLVKDAYFDRNIKEAINNGIYVGTYFYSTALNESEALQEAELTYNCIKDYKLKYPVAYDFEEFGVHRTANLSNDQMHKNAKIFLNYIKSKGYIASLYGSASPLTDTWKMNEMLSYDTWVAHYYTKNAGYSGVYQMWQYTDNAEIPGISTRVDVDIDYVYWAGMKAELALNPYIKNYGWNLINDDWVYLTNDGILAIGWKFINNKWYYFNPNDGKMLKNCVKKIGDNIYLFEASGALTTKACWHLITNCGNKNWYYSNPNGTILKGWLFHKNTWYFLNKENGIMMKNCFVLDNNSVFLLDESGKWVKPNDGWNKFESNGKINWYYFQNGYGAVCWKKIDNQWYYFDNGIMAKGWKKINNIWYYFEENGKMVSNNYVVMGANTYCFNADGAMVSGWWFNCQNTWFFLNSDGSAAKGWKEIKQKWYYFDKDGKMLSNIHERINEKIYVFDDSGAMFRNYWIHEQENWYYAKNSGALAIGWELINNKWYFFEEDGKMFNGAELEINNKTHIFDSSGAWISEKRKEVSINDL